MDNLPIPLLGEISALTITTPDLETSLKFYQKLGFNELMRFDFPFPWIQITDEALLIMLRKDDNPYLALTYYSKNAELVANEIEKKGVQFISKPKDSDMVKRYLFQSPDGLNISVVSIVDGFRKPNGTTMLTMNHSDFFKPETYTNKIAGMFGELAHPVKDLNESIEFWQQLGFRVLSKFDAPYPWAIISDGLAIAGLHQTNSFSYPAITFFAADMKNKIEKLKQQGLQNYIEKGAATIVITTPEKQHINLFKMGM